MDVVLDVVRAAGLSVDGAAEVRGELQSLQGADGETRGVVCQLSQDRSPHGLPQRILRSPPTAGVSGFKQNKKVFGGGLVFVVHNLLQEPEQLRLKQRIKLLCDVKSTFTLRMGFSHVSLLSSLTVHVSTVPETSFHLNIGNKTKINDKL